MCREAVGKIHGKEAAELAHIHSLQGLSSLMLSKDVPARRRDAELAARQNALVEAVATPVCSIACFVPRSLLSSAAQICMQ